MADHDIWSAARIKGIRFIEQAVNLAATAAGYAGIFLKTTGLHLVFSDGAVLGPIGVVPSLCEGRLTLTSGTPVTTSDVTAATSVYFALYHGNRVSLYDGTRWRVYTFAEVSASLAGKAANTNYDVFLYDNAGTLTLDLVAWTNNTTRATALTLQDGVLVKTGATSRRWLGTIRTTGTIGQCEDSLTKRFVANYYNAVRRRLYKETGAGHSYGTATWRAWNNDSTQMLEFLWLGENACEVQVNGNCYPGADGNIGYIGIGINGFTGGDKLFQAHNANQNSVYVNASGFYNPSGSGYHYFSALQNGNATSAILYSELFFSALMWG